MTRSRLFLELNFVQLTLIYCKPPSRVGFSSVPVNSLVFLSSVDRVQLQGHHRLPGSVSAAEGVCGPSRWDLGPERHPNATGGARHGFCWYAQTVGVRMHHEKAVVSFNYNSLVFSILFLTCALLQQITLRCCGV